MEELKEILERFVESGWAPELLENNSLAEGL